MTARKLAKVQLCRRCVLEGPWREDEAGNTVGKCPDCFPTALSGSPEAERDAALAATADANPGALKAALRIIHDHALTRPEFTSNDTRAAMVVAQVPGPTIGAAFRQAAKNGWITKDGYTPSTQLETKAHPVASWSSLIFRGRAAHRQETA